VRVAVQRAIWLNVRQQFYCWRANGTNNCCVMTPKVLMTKRSWQPKCLDDQKVLMTKRSWWPKCLDDQNVLMTWQSSKKYDSNIQVFNTIIIIIVQCLYSTMVWRNKEYIIVRSKQLIQKLNLEKKIISSKRSNRDESFIYSFNVVDPQLQDY